MLLGLLVGRGIYILFACVGPVHCPASSEGSPGGRALGQQVHEGGSFTRDARTGTHAKPTPSR
jgi:hypothetical protein